MEIKKFENELVGFDFESEYVNATDMLKAYNMSQLDSESDKRLDNFIRSKGVKDFITVLESDAQKSATDFQTIIQSKNEYGRSAGTWMHKLLAYRFAAWLSPEFELFVYKTFDEMVQNKLRYQQIQLDHFWDKSDQKDLYS